MDAFLWRNLPVLRFEDKFVAFNPSSRCFAETDKLENLEKLSEDFFLQKKDENIDYSSVNLYFVLTRKCNLSCRYCAAYSTSGKADISKDIIVDALAFAERLYKPKELCIKLSGGEPTQHPAAIKWIVETLREYGIAHSLIIGTNGVISNGILNYLIESNFSFQVSLDGWPQIHNRHRPLKNGEESASHVLNTIKRLVDNHSDFKVRAVITDETVQFMPGFVDYFANLGVKYVALSTVGQCFRARDTGIKSPPPRKYVEQFVLALDRAKERDVSLEIPLRLFNPSNYFCPALSGKELVFSSEGYVSRCPFVLDEDSPFSNPFIIGKYDRKKRDFVIDAERERQIHALNGYNSRCNKCFARYFCASGCRARHMFSSDDIDFGKVDPGNCFISKELARRLLIRMYEESLPR